MTESSKLVGRWVHWDDAIRIEQELCSDGRFEGIVFDEEQEEVIAKASGRWQIVTDAIHWHYTATENIPLPKKVEVNPIVRVDEHRLDFKESTRRISDWYRAVESEESSANFDSDQVRPLLERIAAMIDSGFGETEIAALMKKVRRLKPDQTCQFVYAITCGGVVAPFRIRVFMDDVDAPDISFFGPVTLARRIDGEIEKLDSETAN